MQRANSYYILREVYYRWSSFFQVRSINPASIWGMTCLEHDSMIDNAFDCLVRESQRRLLKSEVGENTSPGAIG